MSNPMWKTNRSAHCFDTWLTEHIPSTLSGQMQGLRAIVRFTGNEQIVGFREDLLEPLAHNGMVVGNQYADHVRWRQTWRRVV